MSRPQCGQLGGKKMKYDFSPVDNMVGEIKGNTNFLRKLFFGRVILITAGVVSAVFLIAALAAS